VVAVILAIVLAAAAGCAPATDSVGPTVPTGPLEPLVVGTEQHMSIEWQAAPRESGVVVWGYVLNRSPYTFDHLRLLVDALGPDGAILGQSLVWSPGLLGGWGRNYFEASMAPAPAYRVRVFSYDRVETDGRRRRPF
jgi:hypothetical protein